MKGKGHVQLPQYNLAFMMKKLAEGSTVTYFKCHQEGHKFFQCKQVKKETKEKKKMTNFSNKTSSIYTKLNYKNKIKSNHYKLKKKKNSKVITHIVGKKDRRWNQPIWVHKEVITNMKGVPISLGFK